MAPRCGLTAEWSKPRSELKQDYAEGAADHGVSEAIYLHDPDGNGVELYWDRPQEQWPRASDGSIDMYTHPLDLAALLKEA
jgi:catechol 2,3-dioxygenase